MGTTPAADILRQIIAEAESNRSLWSQPRKVCLSKTSAGKLGIRLDTIQGEFANRTITVVTQVKPDCQLWCGDALYVFDRILCINGENITNLTLGQLWTFLKSLSSPTVELIVCSLTGLGSKRSRDQISNGSVSHSGVDNKRKPGKPHKDGWQSPAGQVIYHRTGLGSAARDGNQNIMSLPDVDGTQAVDGSNGRRCVSLPATPHQPMVVWPITNYDHLLKHPQSILWDPNPKTVELTRGVRGTFGFKYKVKMSKHVNDVFTLVNFITQDGPAYGKLMVGDWLRSVNRQPLQTPFETNNIQNLLSKETTVRIVLQRPKGLSKKTPDLPPLRDPSQIQVRLVDPNRPVNLPKVRVFVCGSEAQALARLLMPDMLPPPSDNGLFQCVRCTMGIDRQGRISFTSRSSFELPDLTSALHDSNESLEKLKLNDEPAFIHRGSINVEFFIMPDDKFSAEDKFFHHCCQYLFTRTSIFVLTFDGAKVVSSTRTEIERLQNMIHTIRCFDGYECPILTYGLLYNDATVGVDEVRTLFYLPFGQQITMPELFCAKDDAEEQQDMSRLQYSIWKALGDMALNQNILLSSVQVMQELESQRDEGKIFVDEAEFCSIFQEKVPDGGQDLRQVVWTELKNAGEILSSKAAPLSLPHVQNLDKLIFVDPKLLLDCVQNVNVFLQKLKAVTSPEGSRQKGNRGLTTGLISEEDLKDVISQQCPGLMEDNIIHLLEIFGLIFGQKVNGTDSCLPNYLVPYVITDQCTLVPSTTESTELCLHVQFYTHTSSMIYFQLASALNNDAHNLAILGPSSCSLTYLGYVLTLRHNKRGDRIQINMTRTETSSKPYTLYRWLHTVCKMSLGSEVKYLLGPPCPQQDKCAFVLQHNSNIHILDLSRQQVSCGEKLDNHKGVRIWQPVYMMDRYVNELQHNLLKSISRSLNIMNPLDHDWKGLAGLLKHTAEDVTGYSALDDPAYYLLMDEGRAHRLTLAFLLELLQHPDLDRKDLVSKIEKWFETSLPESS